MDSMTGFRERAALAAADANVPMWSPLRARRNAAQALGEATRRRTEREEVEAFLDTLEARCHRLADTPESGARSDGGQ